MGNFSSLCWVAFLGTFLLTSDLLAQNYFFQDYGIRDGLSASKVYAVHEETSGKIWLGTVNGASLFDGYRFENFTTSNGMAPDGVRTIFQSSNGTVWFGHYEGGITRLRNGKFESVELEGLRGSGDIYEFFEPVPGELWIASNGLGAIHLFNADADGEEWNYNQYMGAEGLGDRVFDLCFSRDSTLYFVTDVGIKSLEREGDFSFYKPGGMSNMFQLTCMLEDSHGMRWFGTHNGGLYKYAPGNSDIEIIDVLDGLAHNFVFCLNEDSEGNIWAGTYGGGVSVITPNGSITTFNSENGLHDEKIQCLASDRENNMLIGTNDNGLLIFKSFQFEHFPMPDNYGARRFNAIEKSPDGNLWIGTEKGLLMCDSRGKNPELFDQNQGLTDPNVNAIAQKKNGLWLGTEFGGLFSFDADTRRFNSQFYINQYINQHKVTDLAVDPNGDLWIGTLDGLLRVSETTGELKRFSQRDGLPVNHISVVKPLQSGDVLVGFVGNGAVRLAEDSVTTLVKSGTPSCILEDAQGLLWIGMEGQGIYLVDESKLTVHLTTEDGLPSDVVATIDQDAMDNIWIGSSLGVTKFDKKAMNFVHSGLSAGFGGVEVKRRSSKVVGENIWYGTANGLFRNVPAREKPAFPVGELIITNFEIDGVKTAADENLDLKYNENEWLFEFLTVSLTDPQSIQYKTFLEGRDEQWTEWGSQRSVLYQALPEGTYKFHVRARNRWGKERTVSVPVDLVIHPPWYRSTTFYVISGIAALLLLIAFIKIRERNLRREKRILAEKVRQRTFEVVEKSKELEQKNNDILDSINYARRIQEAILVPESVIRSYGLDTFVFFKPKDIVSGDFYWFNKVGDKVLFSAVDCTGHGVPGAFMSVVGYSLLDKIIMESGETRPEIILDQLSAGVEKFLRQKHSEQMPKDGMDLALVAYDTNTRELEFSGAFNPLYVVRNGEVMEFKADRFSVGSYQANESKEFTRYSLIIEPGDCAYVFSDGYVDQFGGPDYKKFKSRNFKKLLCEIAEMPVEVQRNKLDETLRQWKGSREQLDDIVVIGVKF